MKKLFGLKSSVYNGTVLMRTGVTSYTTEELRQMVKDYLENQTNTLPDGWRASYDTFDLYVYENSKEVPILNQ